MKGFASFVMRGPAQAASAAGVTLLLGFVLPPFAWLSSAVVALVMLRLGPGAVLRMGLPALLAAGLVGSLAWGRPLAVAVGGLTAWVPALFVAAVLRRRARLDDALLSACALGWIVVITTFALIADPTSAWVDTLATLFPPERIAAGMQGLDAAEVRELYQRVAPLMTGVMAASVVFGAVTSVLLARWWQALLDNPGGFQREFHALRLGRVAAGVAAVFCGAALVAPSPMLHGVALVVVAVYVFQGLAVVHGVLAARSMPTPWLVGLYVLAVILPPQVMVGLTLVGIADAWADFRHRVAVDRS